MNEKLKKARINKKLTQQEVADALFIPRTQLVRYEQGINEIPIRYFVILCKLYGVSADEILGI